MVSFDVARDADDGDLRRLLRENPMAGDIHVTLEREPNSFLAATTAGEREQVVVAREGDPARIVAMGSRSIMEAYVNGTPSRVGYLSQLRLDRRHRGGKRLLAGGYALIRRLHGDGSTPFYVTAIMEDNAPARRILEAGLGGLPTYRAFASLRTLIIPTNRRRRQPTAPAVERGSGDDLAAVVACIDRNAPRYQFARRWTAADLSSASRTRGLAMEDFLVVRRGAAVIGCLALWDQRGFKQAVVRGYSRRMGLLRPALNTLAPLLRMPRLPPPGSALRNAFISHVAVDGDDPDVFLALVTAAYNAGIDRALDYVTITFAERDPLAKVIRRALPHRTYSGILYLVFWEDGAARAGEVDERIPRLEAALL